MSNKDIVIKISADGSDVQAELNKINKSAGNLSKSLATAAKGAAVAFTALSAAAADSVREFARFESQFSNVITLLDKSSFKTKTFEQGVKDMRNGLLDLSAQSGQSFEVLNKGLFDLVSAGVDAEKSIEALAAATNLAIAGATDTSVAVDGITSALNAYGLEAEYAEEVSQKFFVAQKFGKTTVEELASGYGKVSATAASMNISLNEVLGAVSAVTLGGTQTSEAFTGLKATFANIIKPTKDAADEAERLGIEFNSTALRSLGLKGFLDQVTQSAGFNEQSMEKLFGSVEALNFIQSIAGAQSNDFANQLQALADKAGVAATFSDALAVKQADVQFQMDRAKQEANALKVSIGEQLAPQVAKAANEFSSMVGELRKNEQAMEDLGNAATFVFRALSATIKGLVAEVQNYGRAIAEIPMAIIGMVNQVGAKLDELRAKIVGSGFGRFILGDEQSASRAAAYTERAQERRAVGNVQMAGVDTLQRPSTSFIGAFEDEFTTPEEQREKELEDLRAHEESKRAIEAEGRMNRAEDQLIADEEGVEKDLEDRELELETKQVRQEEDLLLLQNARQSKLDLLQKFLGLEEKAAEKSTADRNKKVNALETRANAERKAIFEQNLSTFQNTLSGMISSGTAASKVLFVINKIVAISEILNNAQRAAMLARATIPYPASEAVAARQLAAGTISAALVGASTLAGLPAAQKGGIVPGTGRGDKTLMALEPGEMIIPRQQIRPTFGEIFNNLEGEGVDGEERETRITIGFTDEASRFLTLQQREDITLGIGRR